MDLPSLRIGDIIVNQRYGVNGTSIPVGARVHYDVFISNNGILGPSWLMEVVECNGKKMLAFPAQSDKTEQYLLNGQQGSMTILSLPD